MLPTSIRPVLWTHKKTSKGFCPLKICITVSGQRTYRKTNYKLYDNQFKEGRACNCDNAELINSAIRKQILEIEKEVQGVSSIRDLRTSHNNICIEAFSKLVRYDRTRVNRIIEFSGDIRVNEIDLSFLRRFESHERKRGSHPNTIHSTFKYLGQLLRQAEREGIIIENPCKLFKIPKYVKPERDFLSDSELKKLWKLLDKPLEDNSRSTLVYFLLACYTGLRHSDWGNFDAATMYKDNLLRLRARKNKMDVVIPVGPSLKKLVNLTKKVNPALSNQKCNVHLKAIGIMAELGKKITCHTARHTAGNLFASSGLNISIVAKLLAISEGTAAVYFHLSGSDITKQAAVLRTI